MSFLGCLIFRFVHEFHNVSIFFYFLIKNVSLGRFSSGIEGPLPACRLLLLGHSFLIFIKIFMQILNICRIRWLPAVSQPSSGFNIEIFIWCAKIKSYLISWKCDTPPRHRPELAGMGFSRVGGGSASIDTWLLINAWASLHDARRQSIPVVQLSVPYSQLGMFIGKEWIISYIDKPYGLA